jgi:predicted Fe-Mo cluster-binding NifX family protein
MKFNIRVPSDLKKINYLQMKKKIAIPLENGVLSKHFGHCQQFAVLETMYESIENESLLVPPPHEPGVIPLWLAQEGITDVIAGGMGQRAIDLFTRHNINVFVGAEKKDYRILAQELIGGILVAGANYCDH